MKECSAPFSVNYGDVNDDGQINARDVTALMKNIVGVGAARFAGTAA